MEALTSNSIGVGQERVRITDIKKLTDEELKIEWGESAPVAGTIPDGFQPPHWTPEQQQRHTAVEAELESQLGFVSEFYGE